MTIKPFAIQGADLTLGGVNLQAGTSGVVIPGVTQATNYTVEEVQDTGDQTHQFTPNGEVVVVDYVLYNVIVAQGNEGLYADYTATTDGEGYIDNIKVNGQGTYTSQEAADNAANDMYAYIGSASASDRPLVPEDWITIPFRPKMRAGEIENIGGGNANTGNFTFDADTITNGNGLILVTDRGTLAIGSQLETPGVAGHLHIAFNNSNVNPPASDLFLGDDYNYVKLPGYYLNTATQYGIELGTNDRNGGGFNNWRFGTDGVLTLPDGNTRIGNINGIDSIVASTGTGFAVFAQGTGGFNVLQWVADTGSLGSTGTQVAAVIVNSPLASTSGTVQIATGLSYGPSVDNIWTFGTDGSITFPDATVQTTAYTGQGGSGYVTTTSGITFVNNDAILSTPSTGTQYTSSLRTGIPSFLTVDESVTDPQHGFDSNGMWFEGNAELNGYPVRSNFTITETTPVIVEFDFIYDQLCADQGVCVFLDGDAPAWSWGSNPTCISAKYNCGSPELDGLASSIGGNGDNGLLIVGNTYRARFTYNPTITNSVKLETFDTDLTTVIDTLILQDKLSTGAYRVGLSGDSDGNLGGPPAGKAYFTDLSITTGTYIPVQEWKFGSTGDLTLPLEGNILNRDGDVLLSSKIAIPVNINLDGGGASTIYEATSLLFADGGFASTRRSTTDPLFDAGANGAGRVYGATDNLINGGGA